MSCNVSDYVAKGPFGPGKITATPTEQEVADDAAALAKHGIKLTKMHYAGYDVKPKAEVQKKFKPWQGDIMEEVPPMPPKCTKYEDWDKHHQEVKFEVLEGIAYITLNRPAANNAMNDGITSGLVNAVYILQDRPDIRVAVLTGEGRMFCAGGDPKSFQAAQAGAGAIQMEGEEGGPAGPPPGESIVGMANFASGNMAGANAFARLLYDFQHLPQFTIALANGSAMGGGFGLLCVCDMVIAVKTAQFVLSEVKLGVIPATISPYVIAKIGPANAERLFCTAESCNQKLSKEMGLTQMVVDKVDDFMPAVQQTVKRIQQAAPGALAVTKDAILKVLAAPLSESLVEWTAKEYARVRKADEAEKGMAALGSKKKPAWMETTIKAKE